MRFLFVDDHQMVREALTYFLRNSAGMPDVVGVGSVDEAEVHADGQFDLILLDFKLPRISGTNAVVAMQQMYPDTPIIVLSGAITLEEANNALDLGVAGVISKSIEARELWNSISSHMNGAISISKSIVATKDSPQLESLSQRERQVARLLVSGLRNKEIATELGLAEITVRLYMRQLLKKLNARSRTDAVRILLQIASPLI
jgi:two-component system, NarL family, nitrate/nitrite response regulator NarL